MGLGIHFSMDTSQLFNLRYTDFEFLYKKNMTSVNVKNTEKETS